MAVMAILWLNGEDRHVSHVKTAIVECGKKCPFWFFIILFIKLGFWLLLILMDLKRTSTVLTFQPFLTFHFSALH